MQWLRSIVIALVGLLCSVVITGSDYALLDSPLLTFVSIVNGIGISLAVFIIAGTAIAKQNTLAAIAKRLARTNQARMTESEIAVIEASINTARGHAYGNAAALIVFATAYVLALIWSRADLPVVSWSPAWWLSKNQCIHAVCFAAVFLSLSTIHDLLWSARLIGELGDPPK